MSKLASGFLGAALILVGLPTTSWGHNQDHSRNPGTAFKGVTPAKSGKLKQRTRIRLSPRIKTAYQSNFYHVPQSRLDKFDTNADPGERFHDMEGPGDVVSTFGLDSVLRHRLDKKHDLKLKLSTDYIRPLMNGIASYLDLSLRIEGEPTRADKVHTSVAFIPTRFKKNYLEDQGGIAVFNRADYSQFSSQVGFQHRFSKRLSAKVVYELKLRRFDVPFKNRDRTGHTVYGFTTLGLGRKVNAGLQLGVGQVNTPAGTEFGTVVDRSFRTFKGRVWVNLDLKNRWDLTLSGKYRVRQYLTTETDDLAHYNRVDPRIKLGVAATKRVGKHLGFNLNAGWIDSNSNREDPTLNTDSAGYRGIAGGFGISYRL